MSGPNGIGRALLAAACLFFVQQAAWSQEGSAPKDVFGPDSLQQPGVPEGKTLDFHAPDSKTFPGFTHDWWLYIPAQYNEAKPAALMVFQDGAELHEAPTVTGAWRRCSTTSSRRRSCR